MKIISCVPLPGAGVIARHGELAAVTDNRGQDPDSLLAVLTEVAAVAGDGRDLVRMAARAALGCPGQPAWACAGVPADAGLAVLVHGAAVASIRVELAGGNPAAPEHRGWRGDGVVHGGGLALTAGADVADVAEPAAMAKETLHGIMPSQLAGALAAELTGSLPASDRSAVVVEGVLCASEHFNDPGASACRQCGMSLDQPPRNVLRRPRPPLGVLVFDDGTRVTLDGDYVLGREPVLDFDVMAGRARPLRISDPEGTVSRLHLRVSLVGWQVEVSDLGSANGSVLRAPGEERRLAPFEPIVLEPGTRVGIGHRSMQYLAYQGVRP